jgi:hypothetical protein
MAQMMALALGQCNPLALDPMDSPPGPQATTPDGQSIADLSPTGQPGPRVTTPEEQTIGASYTRVPREYLLPAGQPVPTTPRPSIRMLACSNTPPLATSPSPAYSFESEQPTPPASSPDIDRDSTSRSFSGTQDDLLAVHRFGEESFFDSSLKWTTYTEREKRRLQDHIDLERRLVERVERAILFGESAYDSSDSSFDECNGDLDDDDDDANDSEDGDLDDDDDDSTMSMVSMISLDGLSFISSNKSPNWLDDIDQTELPTYENAWSI